MHVYKIAKSDYCRVCPFTNLSICPHGTTWLPLDGQFLNFIFDYFLEIYRANSSLNIICLITMIAMKGMILYVLLA